MGCISREHAHGGREFAAEHLAADEIEEACHRRVSKDKIHLAGVAAHGQWKQLAGVVGAAGGRPPISMEPGGRSSKRELGTEGNA